jgi:hypothetical protein
LFVLISEALNRVDGRVSGKLVPNSLSSALMSLFFIDDWTHSGGQPTAMVHFDAGDLLNFGAHTLLVDFPELPVRSPNAPLDSLTRFTKRCRFRGILPHLTHQLVDEWTIARPTERCCTLFLKQRRNKSGSSAPGRSAALPEV